MFRTRNSLVANLSPLKRNPRSAHDEFAFYNAFHHVSKYDIDRGYIDVAAVKREDQRRKVINAK